MTRLFIIITIVTLFSGCKQDVKETQDTSNEIVETITTTTIDKMYWWREAKFGMFIHWGLYAVPAGEYNEEKCNRKIGEWIMDDLEIPIKEYEKFATQFNPVNYNAEEWVRIAKNAGMKYIVITSKHHDGFALWDSKISEYDIVDASPYGKDLLKPLAEACKKEGIKLCFYHSIMDWHHPDAQAIWEPDYQREKADTLETQINPRFPLYVENYLKPQLKELVNNYGDVGVLWFDGEWIPAYTSEHAKSIYDFLRDLKSDLIVNNRIDKGRVGMSGLNKKGEFLGDFGTPEQEIPETGIPGLDWEACMTMNDTWGYRKDDFNWKSDTVLIKQLVDIASKGGNLLLNIGPKADGTFPEASVERLESMASWMKVNNESIYGTTASPIEAPEWGRITKKGDDWYLFVFESIEESISLEVGDMPLQNVKSLSGQKLKYSIEDGTLTIDISELIKNELIPVIKLS